MQFNRTTIDASMHSSMQNHGEKAHGSGRYFVQDDFVRHLLPTFTESAFLYNWHDEERKTDPEKPLTSSYTRTRILEAPLSKHAGLLTSMQLAASR